MTMFDFTYPNAPADQRGWGPGWPNCQTAKMTKIGYPSFSGYAMIRAEVRELLVALLTETEARGYKLDGPVLDDWAFVCRPTKRSDGSLTNIPSNHSWGLAVDLNATQNPYGGSTYTIPKWMPPLWKSYGWRWLGPPIKDWQHFDFCGNLQDARRMTGKAAEELGGTTVKELDEYESGEAAFREKAKSKGTDPGPPPESKGSHFKAGWASQRFGYNNPKSKAAPSAGG